MTEPERQEGTPAGTGHPAHDPDQIEDAALDGVVGGMTLSELNMQNTMEQESKTKTTLSNTLKSTSDSDGTIITNMK